MNITFSNFTLQNDLSEPLSTAEIIKGYCDEVDRSILICTLFIFSYFAFKKILPVVRDMVNVDAFKQILNWYEDALDILGYSGVAFILVVALYQSPPVWFKVWFYSILAIFILIRLRLKR